MLSQVPEEARAAQHRPKGHALGTLPSLEEGASAGPSQEPSGKKGKQAKTDRIKQGEGGGTFGDPCKGVLLRNHAIQQI